MKAMDKRGVCHSPKSPYSLGLRKISRRMGKDDLSAVGITFACEAHI